VLARNERGEVHSIPPVPGAVTEPGIIVYRFGAGVFYANAQRLSDEVLGLVGGDNPPKWFVFDAAGIDDVDYTGGQTLAELGEQLRQRGIVVAAVEVRQAVLRELQQFRVSEASGELRIFETVQDALDAFHAEE
jgi:sulfate permease, SulP family